MHSPNPWFVTSSEKITEKKQNSVLSITHIAFYIFEFDHKRPKSFAEEFSRFSEAVEEFG